MSQLLAAGRVLVSPLTGAARWYNRTAQANPFAVGVVTTGLKTSAADWFAQKVIEKREDFDWTRHAAFCAFGFAYLGGFQYWLYNVKFAQVGAAPAPPGLWAGCMHLGHSQPARLRASMPLRPHDTPRRVPQQRSHAPPLHPRSGAAR